MKKTIKILALSILLFSCSNPELEKQEKKYEESKCKVEFSKSLSDHGINTMVLAERVGMKKDLDSFMKLQSDSTITCDSLKNAWSKFQDDVNKKSSK